ncbi:MAG: host attachment protein [Rhizobium giardinii]
MRSSISFSLHPRVLGILRKCVRPSAGGTVTAEVAKDVVKFPNPEIEHCLSE